MNQPVATLSKEEVLEKINRGQAQVVNVLAAEHYGLGVIKGSLKIPLAQLQQRLGELNPKREVITYCAGYSCPASKTAAEQLSALGYQARAYEGGIKEWTAAGLPVEPAQPATVIQESVVDQASGLSGLPSAGQQSR